MATDSPPAIPRRRFRQRDAAKEVLGVCVLAVAAFFVVNGGAFLFGAVGYLDPWIYTGYISDYGGLLERFGRTYYSTRVAAIWPQEALYALLGDHAYVGARWLVLVGAGAGVAAFIRQRSGRWVAYGAGLALIFSAPFLLEFQDDYTQEVGIAYALLALPFLMARRPGWVSVGGVLVSLAINAHEGLLYLVIPILAACLVGTLMGRGWRQALIRSGLMVAGFFLAQAMLSLIMGLRYGWIRSNYLFQEVSIDFYQQLSGGLARNWSVEWSNDYSAIMTTTIIVTAWIGVATIILAIMRSRAWMPLAAGSVGMLTLVGMILYSHFAKGTGFVGLHYTLVYATTAALLSSWFALGVVSSGRSARPAAIAALIGAVWVGFLLPSWVLNASPWLWAWWIAVVIAGLGLLAALIPRFSGIGPVIGVVAVAGFLIPLGPLTTGPGVRPLYASVAISDAETASRNLEGASVRSMARQFLMYVGEHVPPSMPMSVYYPGIPKLNSIQSTLLWGYTCTDCPRGSPAFPRFPKGVQDALLQQGKQALVLLSPSRKEVELGRRLAKRSPLAFTQTTPITRLASGGRVVWVTTSYTPQAGMDSKREG